MIHYVLKEKYIQAHSSGAEHCFDVAGVSGSIPLAPTRVRSF
jgi:hypothetical protein